MNQLAKMKAARRNQIPVILCRGDERHCFDSCKHAAQFLAKRDGQHAAGYIIHLLARRNEEILAALKEIEQ